MAEGAHQLTFPHEFGRGLRQFGVISLQKGVDCFGCGSHRNDHLLYFSVGSSTDSATSELDVGENERPQPRMVAEKSFSLSISHCPLSPSRHRENFRYFSRTRAPSILLMNKLIRPVVQCGPTSLPRSSQHRRFGSLVFAQVQALDFGLFHSVEFSRMLYVLVMVQPGTRGTSFCFQGGAISSFQPESW